MENIFENRQTAAHAKIFLFRFPVQQKRAVNGAHVRTLYFYHFIHFYDTERSNFITNSFSDRFHVKLNGALFSWLVTVIHNGKATTRSLQRSHDKLLHSDTVTEPYKNAPLFVSYD